MHGFPPLRPGVRRAVSVATAALLQTAAHASGALVLLIQVALIPLVLVRRKEASSTIAWILTLIFVPLLGAFLFLLFGRDRVRMSAARKRKVKEESRARLRGDKRAVRVR